jgi:ribosome-associated protein YbcJ (S4-like RNA binding protein)
MSKKQLAKTADCIESGSMAKTIFQRRLSVFEVYVEMYPQLRKNS